MAVKAPESPHIGKMLDRHIRKHRFHQASLSRAIGVHVETIANFLKRPDNRISNIWKICFALRYNFLSDLAAQLPPDMPCAPTPKDERIAELEQQVQQLTAERDTLKEVVEVLRPK